MNGSRTQPRFGVAQIQGNSMKDSVALLLIAVIVGMGGCATVTGSYVTMDKPAQAAMTPDAALAVLKQGNDRFVSGAMI